MRDSRAGRSDGERSGRSSCGAPKRDPTSPRAPFAKSLKSMAFLPRSCRRVRASWPSPVCTIIPRDLSTEMMVPGSAPLSSPGKRLARRSGPAVPPKGPYGRPARDGRPWPSRRARRRKRSSRPGRRPSRGGALGGGRLVLRLAPLRAGGYGVDRLDQKLGADRSRTVPTGFPSSRFRRGLSPAWHSTSPESIFGATRWTLTPVTRSRFMMA